MHLFSQCNFDTVFQLSSISALWVIKTLRSHVSLKYLEEKRSIRDIFGFHTWFWDFIKSTRFRWSACHETTTARIWVSHGLSWRRAALHLRNDVMVKVREIRNTELHFLITWCSAGEEVLMTGKSETWRSKSVFDQNSVLVVATFLIGVILSGKLNAKPW